MDEDLKEVKITKKKPDEKNPSLKWLIILIIALVIVLVIFLYFKLHVKKCSNIDCFNSAMEECKKASFISEAEDASWLYTIQEKKGDFGCFLFDSKCKTCVINVKLLQAKKGTSDVRILENLEMNCELVFEYVGAPNADLGKCSGKLKEGMQDLMIKKMHAYILSNVGQIGEELNTGI